MKKIAVINSTSMDCSYGGVSPFMRNMHPYLKKNFELDYFYLPDSWIKFPIIPGRIKIMLYLWLKRNKIKNSDLILSHIPEGSYLISFFKKPYIHIHHGNYNPMSQSRYKLGKYFMNIFEHFYKKIEKTAEIEYTVGPVIKNRVKLFNPISHAVKPLPSHQRKGFIYAGRLEIIKNIERLIKLYSKLPANVKAEHHLYIAGYGTQEQNLKNLVKLLNETENIHFTGNLTNPELLELEKSLTIYLMTSKQEGLPSAIAEALTLGMPVVTTNPGDIGLVIKNNYNGFIFPQDFKDEDYLNAIQTVLKNFESFSKNALESSKVFDAENITMKVVKDINNILDK